MSNNIYRLSNIGSLAVCIKEKLVCRLSVDLTFHFTLHVVDMDRRRNFTKYCSAKNRRGNGFKAKHTNTHSSGSRKRNFGSQEDEPHQKRSKYKIGYKKYAIKPNKMCHAHQLTDVHFSLIR